MEIKLALSWHPVGTKLALSQDEFKLLKSCLEPKPIVELMSDFNWKDRTKFRRRFLLPLVDQGLVQMTILEKPNSRLQKYMTTEAGKLLLK